MPQEWIGEFSNDGINAENREAFETSMQDYATKDEAVVAGFNAKKLVGAPFRMPESLDKLPNDESRQDFTTKAKSLGFVAAPQVASDVSQLDDVDFKTGLAEGKEPNEGLVGKLKEWAVAEGIDKATLGKLATFYNGPLTEFVAEQMEQMKLDNAKTCNDELIKHFGTEAKVKELSTLMTRAIMNKAGLSAEEAAEVVDTMADTMLTKNPVMARAMLNLLSPLAAEGSTDGGDGPGSSQTRQVTPYEFKKSLHPNSDGLWGDPNETWEDQGVSLKTRAIKEGILPSPE